ncbi:hypothetical protein GCM10022267_38150 [Lentzea roselyniae]|uniref:Uncharacterized protein n=1 Tax=Lentzea roselyniae TaxID=531940 RepID=A0ABP7B3C0_9PSEU
MSRLDRGQRILQLGDNIGNGGISLAVQDRMTVRRVPAQVDLVQQLGFESHRRQETKGLATNQAGQINAIQSSHIAPSLAVVVPPVRDLQERCAGARQRVVLAPTPPGVTPLEDHPAGQAPYRT